MPYVKNIRRLTDREAQALPMADNAGELNYLITALIVRHLTAHDLNYQTINDIVGALEGAKAEFQRRVVAPFEDNKIVENGDVYPAWSV